MSFDHIIAAFSKFNISDIIDILFLFFLFYYLILLIKGTKSYQVAIGLALIGVVAFIASFLKLMAFSFILNNFLTYLIFAIIVLFQDELRKILAEIGSKLKTKYDLSSKSEIIDEIVNTVIALSLSKIGAIIAIEREINVKNYVNKPVKIDADINKDLLLTIFTPHSPLHDGAVIISKNRIELARCFFAIWLPSESPSKRIASPSWFRRKPERYRWQLKESSYGGSIRKVSRTGWCITISDHEVKKNHIQQFWAQSNGSLYCCFRLDSNHRKSEALYRKDTGC
jgi:diadenylate cyclase